MKITVCGLGYVGLVVSACLASLGHDVIGYDNDQEKIESLLLGIVPISEPGLQELIAENCAGGRLLFSAT
ncbi:MAG: UDP-glucose 6-dehydrogenase, partial [Candidatus Eremiobacteraeota bacterium]|nr:UDP-glucose 6-dehydrogenase [Candidatus Eremiobacteraeota bacterium]